MSHCAPESDHAKCQCGPGKQELPRLQVAEYCQHLAPIARECTGDHGLMASVHPVCICYAAQSRSRTVRAIIRPRCLGNQDVIPRQWEQGAVFSNLQPGKLLLAWAAMTLCMVGFGCAMAHSTRIGLLYKKFSGQHDCRCVNTKAQRAWLRV